MATLRLIEGFKNFGKSCFLVSIWNFSNINRQRSIQYNKYAIVKIDFHIISLINNIFYSKYFIFNAYVINSKIHLEWPIVTMSCIQQQREIEFKPAWPVRYPKKTFTAFKAITTTVFSVLSHMRNDLKINAPIRLLATLQERRFITVKNLKSSWSSNITLHWCFTAEQCRKMIHFFCLFLFVSFPLQKLKVEILNA